jgi:hypothetical protein
MIFRDLFFRVRNFLNKHSPAVTLVALVILSITAGDIVQQVRRPKFDLYEVQSYYYDLETDRLFVGKTSGLPPIAGPGSTGPDDLTAVRAYVFACHNCDDMHDRYIGWVEGFSKEAREAFANIRSDDSRDPGLDRPYINYPPLSGPGALGPPAIPGPAGAPGLLGRPPLGPPGMPFAAAFESGHLIAQPDMNDATWKDRFYEFNSPEAVQIRKKSQERCGASPMSCVP